MGSVGSQTTVKALWQGMDTEVWGVCLKMLELMEKQDRVEPYVVWGRQRAIWQLFIQSVLIHFCLAKHLHSQFGLLWKDLIIDRN